MEGRVTALTDWTEPSVLISTSIAGEPGSERVSLRAIGLTVDVNSIGGVTPALVASYVVVATEGTAAGGAVSGAEFGWAGDMDASVGGVAI